MNSYTRTASDDDTVLPFPCLSKTWYMSNHVNSSSECNVNEKNTSAVIFPMLSREWHQRRGKLFSKNNNRNHSVHVDGHLQNNFMDLEKKVFVESNPQRKEKYRIILAVGKCKRAWNDV